MITLFFSILIWLIVMMIEGIGLIALVAMVIIGLIFSGLIKSSRKKDNEEHKSERRTDNMNNTFTTEAVRKIDSFLKEQGVVDIKKERNPVIDREHGKEFDLEDHIRALIYALLTNQRKWSDVEPKLPQIDNLFFNYDLEKIKEHDGEYFERGIRALKCGNISIRQQMEGLHHDISVFESLVKRCGSMDNYVTSMQAEDVVRELSEPSSKYKLKGVGNALAWEYLRNVGIDGSKPDTHLRRFFGADRIGVSMNSEATEEEVISAVESISNEGGYTKFEIDYLIWAYCASGKGEVCTASPACNRCVIREYCNKCK
ncbi:hypothetical protein [Butyrivibrio sp. MC2013]|uniref:hypothetical protein n=1 Tax=Butyrivibrio sp. MC2013 TaxID=1280686 RepID=UPI00041B330C|nr:hypothetical protein [Butyrivibrio sp. MC2013]